MNRLLIIIGCALGAFYIWYTNFRTKTGLEKHMDEQDALLQLGEAVNDMNQMAIPPIGTVGQYPLTGAVITPMDIPIAAADQQGFAFMPHQAGTDNSKSILVVN